MREEYEERGNFNPVKFGLIGALIVAAIVFAAMQFRSYTENKEAKETAIADANQQIDKLKADNTKLEKELAALKKEAEESEAKWKKSLAQKDSALTSAKRQMDSEGRAADDKL